MATPYLGQLVAPNPDTELDQNYYFVRLDTDGSRRILSRSRTISGETWADVVAGAERVFPGIPVVMWGPTVGAPEGLSNALFYANDLGQYLPYPAADGIQTFPVDEPVNQLPYLQAFLNHCCTFAHELLVDHQPHSSRLRGIHSWNIATDITLDVDSINSNRVGMRYYRGRLGYFYDKIEDFEALPRDTSTLGQFDLSWRDELAEMQTLDRDLCDDCRDDGGGSRLRDFIHYCNVAEWDRGYWML